MGTQVSWCCFSPISDPFCNLRNDCKVCFKKFYSNNLTGRSYIKGYVAWYVPGHYCYFNLVSWAKRLVRRDLQFWGMIAMNVLDKIYLTSL